jgi:hypothetical protein
MDDIVITVLLSFAGTCNSLSKEQVACLSDDQRITLERLVEEGLLARDTTRSNHFYRLTFSGTLAAATAERRRRISARETDLSAFRTAKGIARIGIEELADPIAEKRKGSEATFGHRPRPRGISVFLGRKGYR